MQNIVRMMHPTILSSLQMYQNNLESFLTKMCSVCMLAVQTSSSVIGEKSSSVVTFCPTVIISKWYVCLSWIVRN